MFPDSWHDSCVVHLSGFMYPTLADGKTPPGMGVLWDIAFSVDTKHACRKIVRGYKYNETAQVPEREALRAIHMILKRLWPKERQSAEWDVCAIKASFVRIHLALSPNLDVPGRALGVCTHLLNLRTRQVGLNHI